MDFIPQQLRGFTGRQTGSRSNPNALPAYESLPSNPSQDDTTPPSTNRHRTSASSSTSTLIMPSDSDSNPDSPSQYPHKTHRSPTNSPITLTKMIPALPSLRTFSSNFTLGFADGLTVPFALTAGLSSLGQTKTVIYAGMAEICAGSISMGIGGYLAARTERREDSSVLQSYEESEEGEGEDSRGGLLSGSGRDVEKELDLDLGLGGEDGEMDVLRGYLAPLRLSAGLEGEVLAHVRVGGYSAVAISEMLGHGDNDSEQRRSSPVFEGLAVSVGYLVGGVLPLFPYFFVADVNTGLGWSFAVCVVALFVFGFGKHFLLNRNSRSIGNQAGAWAAVKSSMWEGLQMVVLGSIAALAAVLCVKLFAGVL